ncbi:MAG: D-alanyl-D-alanine carboxypeptidase family protein [Eubacteriales bacterium]
MKKRKAFRIHLSLLLVWICFTMTVSASGPDPLFADEATETAADIISGSPEVSAQSAILMDINGTVLWEKNADTRMPPASTTKIMTALTVLRRFDDLDIPVKIPAAAVGVEGSSVYLYENEELTLRQLMYAMLMESANDAAVAIAYFAGGSTEAFADMMNETAASLSLSDTHFMNPHGLDDEAHYTTAADLAAMTREALQFTDFCQMVSTYKMEIPLKGNEGVRLLVNHNRLLKTCAGCIGVKTGYTKKSGRCLVSAAERDGCTLICVTLQAPDDWNDHCALYEWGFAQIESVLLSETGEQYAVLPVVGGVTDSEDGIATVAVKNEDALSVILPREGQNIRKAVILPRFLYAPVQAGETVGHVVYYNNGEEIGRLPLYACDTVDMYVKPSLWERIRMLFAKIIE